jgi:putative flippase GtrA
MSFTLGSMYEAVLTKIGNVMSRRQAKLTKQFVRYMAVAGIGYGLDVVTLSLLYYRLHQGTAIAVAGGFIMGLAATYPLSVRYVFKNPKLKSRTLDIGVFAIIGVVGLGIAEIIVLLLTNGLGINVFVSKIIATVGVTVWNFVGRKSLYHD